MTSLNLAIWMDDILNIVKGNSVIKNILHFQGGVSINRRQTLETPPGDLFLGERGSTRLLPQITGVGSAAGKDQLVPTGNGTIQLQFEKNAIALLMEFFS